MRLHPLYVCAAAVVLAGLAGLAHADGGPSSASLGAAPTMTEDEIATSPTGAFVASGDEGAETAAFPAPLVPWVPADEPRAHEGTQLAVAPEASGVEPASACVPGRLVRHAVVTVYEPWYRFRPRRPWRIGLQGSVALIEGPAGRLGEPLPAGAPAFDWGRVSLDPAFGGRATVGYAFTPWDRVEVRGSWWSATQGNSRQAGVLGFSPPVGGVSLPTNATLETEDTLLSAEATWWWTLGGRGALEWSAGAGARYVRLEETSRVRDWSPLLVGGPPMLRAQADNDFLAAQLAGSARWQIHRRVEVGLLAKGLVGVLNRNVAIQDASLLAGGAHRTSRKGTDLGWGVEVEVSVAWRLSGCLGLTAGYGLLYLGEVARAQEAMDFSQANTGAVQTRQATGDFVVHMVFAGVELRL